MCIRDRRGAVLGADGQPVAGARVLVGRIPPATRQVAGFGTVGTPPPQRTATDAEGAFALEGLEPGRLDVQVRTAQDAPWTGEVTVIVGQAAELVVTLEAGATLAGTVHDPGGRPVAGARVMVGAEGDLATSTTRTAADGSFRLTGLQPGLVRVDAWKPGVGRASAARAPRLSREVRWDARLEPGEPVGGRVVDGEGEPLVGWAVDAMDAGHALRRVARARTGSGGAFRLEGCPAGGVTLEVHQPGVWDEAPAVRVPDVAAGDLDVQIEVPAGSLATAFFHGRLQDWEGRARPGTCVLVQAEGRWPPARFECEMGTGAFRIGPLRAGPYRLEFHAPGAAPQIHPRRVLAPGEEHAIGLVTLEPTGTLVVHLERSGGGALAGEHRITASVQKYPGALPEVLVFAGAEGRSPPLRPGPFTLSIRGPGVAAVDRPVFIRPGEETHEYVAVEVGVSRVVAISLAEDVQLPPAMMRFTVTSSGGEVVSSSYVNARVEYPFEVLVPGLTSDAYTAEIMAPGGYGGRVTFEVGAGGEGDGPIPLVVR